MPPTMTSPLVISKALPLRVRTTLNLGEDDVMYLDGYKKDHRKTILLWIAIVCSGGIIGLVFYWRRDWFIKLSSDQSTVAEADVFLLEDAYQDVVVSHVADLAKTTRFYMKPPLGSVLEGAPLVMPSAAGVDGGKFSEVKSVRYFDCKRVRYLWNATTAVYEQLHGIPDVPLEYFELHQRGLNSLERSQRLVLFGLNAIAIRVASIPEILLEEALTPFYAFQVFSVVLWYIEPYTFYASVIVGISVLSLSTQIFQTWHQQTQLRDRVQDYATVEILKDDGTTHEVPSETLVPGDIILIPKHGAKVVCDSVLLSGNCIVNESSLTGESVPNSKVPVVTADKAQLFKIRSNNRSMLYCGTYIMQSRGVEGGLAKAMVLRTGFMTSKGELIRDILYFRRIDFKFQNQAFWYILALSCMAAIGMVYSIVILNIQKKSVNEIIIRTLDLVTIVVPPALPAALTSGLIFSQWRLQRHKIFCISPRVINMCGILNLVCFDKTGTLTEDRLDLKSVLPVTFSDKDGAKFSDLTAEIQYTDTENPVVRAMATCHSLSLMDSEDEPPRGSIINFGGTPGSVLIGDPLDSIMFKFIHWKLVVRTVPGFGTTSYRVVNPILTIHKSATQAPVAGDGGQGLVLLREFPFASVLQRMGVIIFNTKSKRYESYVKGSAEKVVPLCNQKSVPPSWAARLEEYASKGNRVIVLAWKPLTVQNPVDANKISRQEAETGLQFIGLVVFENSIKEDTAGVIEEIYQANYRIVMLTGDNIHTAISVAQTCGILRPNHKLSIVVADEKSVSYEAPPSDAEAIRLFLEDQDKEEKYLTRPTWDDDPESVPIDNNVLALSGETIQIIRKHHPHVMPKIVLQGTVFARVSPIEKQYMVEQFQAVGYQVAMCGDGANDCGALRAAHAGISLSESEAAAAAEFTSTGTSIACVPLVLREGRCALVTFFGIFFLMATYSMCQFSSILLIYWTGVTFTDWEFLYQDLFELTILAIVIAFALPYNQLTRDNTPSSLKSFPALFGLAGHVLIILAAQVCAFLVVRSMPCTQAKGTDPTVLTPLSDLLPSTTSTSKTPLFDTSTSDGGDTTNATVLDTMNEGGTGCEPYATFVVGSLQIIFLSCIFAKGAPFRMPFYMNSLHMATASGMMVFVLFCMLNPTRLIARVFDMNYPSDSVFGSRFIFLGIAVGYLAVAAFFEHVIIDKLVTNWLNKSHRFRTWRSLNREDIEDKLLANIAEFQAVKKF